MHTAEQARLKVSQLTLAKDYLSAYEYLKHNGLPPDVAPGAWELLWRRVHDAKIGSLSRYVQEDLWAAGFRNADIAIERARHAIAESRSHDAVEAIEEAYGPSPTDAEAAELLAQALISINKERATALLQLGPDADLKRTLTKIDLHRSLHQLNDALDLLDKAETLFPDSNRLKARRARISEALGNWDEALGIWRGLAEGNSSQAVLARQFVMRLLLKFENTDDAICECAKLIASDASLIDKIRGAALLNQNSLLVELLKKAALSDTVPIASSEWEEICRFLIDRGDIGLAAHLSDLNLPVGIANLATLMATSFDEIPDPEGEEVFSFAAGIRSPDIQLPFTEAQRSAARSEFQSASQISGKSADQVLIVNATLAAGGAERQIIPLIQALLTGGIPEDRIHVAIFSLAPDRGHAHFAKSVKELNVNLHDLPNRQLSLDALPPTTRGLVGSLPASLRRDILALWPVLVQVAPRVLHGWQDRSSVACAYLGSLLGVEKTVMTARNMKPQDRMVEERHYLPIFDQLKKEDALRLVANSPQGARDYEKWIGLDKGVVGVIPNGIDTALQSTIAQTNITRQGTRKHDNTRPVVVGGIFRLAANKRPLLWLRTVAALRDKLDRPIKVRLVGTGPYRAQVDKLAQTLGLEDIEIIPRLSSADQLYGSIDCLLLMSRVEGTPNVLLEAQACGLPVMACDVGGVGHTVLSSGPGRGLVMPADIEPEHAATTVANYLSTALYEGAEERRGFIERNYSLPRLADDVRQIYGSEIYDCLARRDLNATRLE